MYQSKKIAQATIRCCATSREILNRDDTVEKVRHFVTRMAESNWARNVRSHGYHQQYYVQSVDARIRSKQRSVK
jgi:hypothetical protein